MTDSIQQSNVGTNPSFNTPYLEMANTLNNNAAQIQVLETRIKKMEENNQTSERLCNSFDHLMKLKIFYLLTNVMVTATILSICVFVSGENGEWFKWVLRFLLGVSCLKLLYETVNLPNHMKALEDKLKSLSEQLTEAKKDINLVKDFQKQIDKANTVVEPKLESVSKTNNRSRNKKK